jgi:hypothetical protein
MDMDEYTVRNLQLMRGDNIVAVFMPGIDKDMAIKIVFCLNMGCDVMTHLVECEDGGPTLEDVVFERVGKGVSYSPLKQGSLSLAQPL